MPKTLETNRQEITLHLYLRGKRKKPSTSANFEPGLLLDNPKIDAAFSALQEAAKRLTVVLYEEGELTFPESSE